MAADTASIATISKKLESNSDEDEYMKKFTLNDHRRPIRKPALAPVLNVLMFAQRL